MILAAMSLFQREGYAATSWRRLVEESGAPWGSAHHYFPGGKEELGIAAVNWAASNIAAFFARSFPEDGDAPAGVRKMFMTSADQLAKSSYTAGCPISTVALETSGTSPKLRAACEAAFELWRQTLREGLVRCGIEKAQAASMATAVLSAFEGALIQARTSRSKEPLHICANLLAQVLANAKG